MLLLDTSSSIYTSHSISTGKAFEVILKTLLTYLLIYNTHNHTCNNTHCHTDRQNETYLIRLMKNAELRPWRWKNGLAELRATPWFRFFLTFTPHTPFTLDTHPHFHTSHPIHPGHTRDTEQLIPETTRLHQFARSLLYNATAGGACGWFRKNHSINYVAPSGDCKRVI